MLYSLFSPALLLVLFWANHAAADCAATEGYRTDCGYYGIDQYGCESKGCCWQPAGTDSAVPWCFYPSMGGYSLQQTQSTATGFTGTLSTTNPTTVMGGDISPLKLEVIFESDDHVHIRITDAKNARWEVPQSVVSRPSVSKAASNPAYDVKVEQNPFTITVFRKEDGAVLFQSTDSLVFKDQYIELTTTYDEGAATYGLGESTRSSAKLQPGTTYTMWARDQPSADFNSNLYGAHPFYLQVKDGKAHGVFLLNSNGLDVSLGSDTVTFKAIGGVIDLYVFVGSTPQAVVQQYTSVIGRPAMMPYWSLGFHNCKYGYKSIWEVEDVVAKYAEAGIPLDTQWVDIDYMDAYKDFTLDPNNYPQSEVKQFVDNLHAAGQSFVPIIDPGIMVESGYKGYEDGVAADLFIKDIAGGYYLGQVWPGPTYFPDFFHPAAQNYWTEQLRSFHDMVPVDGIWIDMNEVSNFCNVDGRGQVCYNPGNCPGESQTTCCLVCSTVDPNNRYDFPPYNIGNGFGALSVKTIAVSATHYGNVTEYDAHNLYGLTEAIATAESMTTIRGKRPFVLSRSSFASSGVHTAHWTGDNAASWNDLKASIVTMINFNMFGMPMVGADICGFLGDTTEELCARWIEVGAFYPFSRNHNTLGAAPQELYLWDSVTEASKNALGMRYKLLPYLYTLFHKANRNGDTVARALWMNFPSDATTLDINSQFMLGDSILVSPVLDQGSTNVHAYFPQSLWYSFSDFTKIDADQGGLWLDLYTPLTSVNVHIKGKTIVPLQQGGMTTTDARKTPFTLVVALCSCGGAFGDLFLDDGEQVELNQYTYIKYAATVNSVTGTVEHNNYSGASSVKLDTVHVLGLTTGATSASVNGAPLSADQFSFDSAKGVLTFTGVDVPMSETFTLEWH